MKQYTIGGLGLLAKHQDLVSCNIKLFTQGSILILDSFYAYCLLNITIYTKSIYKAAFAIYTKWESFQAKFFFDLRLGLFLCVMPILTIAPFLV